MKITVIDFECPYTVAERYELVCSGEFGVFEMTDHHGDTTGFRGTRLGYGVTGVYDTYKAALEAAFTEFGPKAYPVRPTMERGENKDDVPLDYEETT